MTSRHRAVSFLAPIAASVALLMSVTIVAAHAELVRAIPADGETVPGPIRVVSGRYSEDLGGNSRLVIKDAAGSTVATGGIDPDDPRRMVARPEPPLVEGTFTVESTTISAEDGDIDRVTWTFTVTAAATSAPPTASPTASGSPAESPTAAPTSAPPSASPPASPSASPAPTTPTSSGGDVVLPIIAALAIVAVAAGFLLRRNRSGT
jgi:methionine-rich copper-binding protein CopC